MKGRDRGSNRVTEKTTLVVARLQSVKTYLQSDVSSKREFSRWAPSSERTSTLTTPAFSIHDVSVTDLIRNCELPGDGAVLVPKHVGAAITF
jgi:hypothetical protein